MVDKYEEKNKFSNSKGYIRIANICDANVLSELSKNLIFLSFPFSENIPDWFVDDISLDNIKKRFENNKFQTIVYILENRIVGFVTIKNRNQILYIYANPQYYEVNILRSFFEYIKKEYDVSKMFVNAPLYTIKIFHYFGFIKNGNEFSRDGVKYQPMKYKKD